MSSFRKETGVFIIDRRWYVIHTIISDILFYSSILKMATSLNAL